MDDKLISELEAIVGAPDTASADPAGRALLTAELAAAMTGDLPAKAMATDDPAVLAAYIDRGLSQEERSALICELAASPGARAELDAATALLNDVEALPPSEPAAAVLRHAREMLAVPAEKTSSGWDALRRHLTAPLALLSTPRGRIGAAVLACSVLAGIVLTGPQLRGPDSAPPITPGPNTSDQQTSSFLGHLQPAPAPAMLAGWSAAAASQSTGTIGLATGNESETEAVNAAVTSCAAHGASDCRVLLSGQAACVAIASPLHGAATASMGAQPDAAKNRALSACSRTGTRPCKVVGSACGD